jgi:hypothetical protein
MNKKSRVLQERNKLIQQQFAEELAKTSLQTDKPKSERTGVMEIYSILAAEHDLSVDRVREIVGNRRI